MKTPQGKSAKCKNCKKPFVIICRRNKFCSNECSNIFFKKNYKDYYGLERIVTTKRKCLNCKKTFPSKGSWNRICHKCKWSPEYRNGSEATYKFESHAKR